MVDTFRLNLLFTPLVYSGGFRDNWANRREIIETVTAQIKNLSSQPTAAAPSEHKPLFEHRREIMLEDSDTLNSTV